MPHRYQNRRCLLTFFVAGCDPSGEGLTVANKKACIPEAARRLVACNDEAECEKGVTRFASYCYNNRPRATSSTSVAAASISSSKHSLP